MNYWWVRIYDYDKSDEDAYHKDPDREYDWSYGAFQSYKGTLLDEYYLSGEDMTREQAKKAVTEKSGITKFAKPRKEGRTVYAYIMDSNEFFYNRFTKTVDTICFHCHTPIKGKEKDFPKMEVAGETVHFCSHDCHAATSIDLSLIKQEGEWQNREAENGVYGYIYHIYNRKTNQHYIGQTIYAPFFRWQEHFKAGLKGNITDIVFETITEVRVQSQEYLNSIEAWWISKYIDDYGRDNVMNLNVPKITEKELLEEYHKLIEGQTMVS